MPDITLCSNNSCLLKDKCYRSRAIPSEYWQAFASFPGGEDCKYFYPLEEGMKIKDE